MPSPPVVPALVQAGPRIDLDAAEFRAEQKQIDAAGDHAQIGVVQDHPPEGVIGRRSRIGDGQIRRVARELRGRGAAEEIVDRRGRGAGNVAAVIGDAAAPRLAARRHQDERIEDDAQPARFQIADAADDRLIRRRAAVDESTADLRDRNEAGEDCVRPEQRQTSDPPEAC